MPNKVAVFVYGTLRSPRSDPPDARTCFYPQIAPDVLCAAPAYLEGVTLYDLGAYPGLRPDGEMCVRGDLFVVRPRALALMDRIEGHPQFFRRGRAWVRTAEDGSAHARVYWAPAPLVEEAPQIACGDWLAYQRPGGMSGANTDSET
jgi:gamma-glutamylcyclotransferase (GGCT)/AIG2-like uncharacterized protein YtfP